MKPIIGIIGKYDEKNNHKVIFTYDSFFDKIIESGGIPIVIKDTSDINVDGIILQGGNDIDKNEIKIVKYAYNKDIPLLGICLGMQTIGMAFNGKIKKIKNHNVPNVDKVHEVKLKKDSKIYEILGEKVIVNSRHNYALINTELDITGKSTDGIIEAIEDKNKKIFIGLQWHPESLNNNDSKKLFTYFISQCNKKK